MFFSILLLTGSKEQEKRHVKSHRSRSLIRADGAKKRTSQPRRNHVTLVYLPRSNVLHVCVWSTTGARAETDKSASNRRARGLVLPPRPPPPPPPSCRRRANERTNEWTCTLCRSQQVHSAAPLSKAALFFSLSLSPASSSTGRRPSRAYRFRSLSFSLRAHRRCGT